MVLPEGLRALQLLLLAMLQRTVVPAQVLLIRHFFVIKRGRCRVAQPPMICYDMAFELILHQLDFFFLLLIFRFPSSKISALDEQLELHFSLWSIIRVLFEVLEKPRGLVMLSC